MTSNENLTKLNTAGKGAYGIVYKARGNKDKKQYAVKRMFKEPTTAGFGNCREIDMMSRLKHPNIVSLLNISQVDPFSSNRPMTPVKRTQHKNMDPDVNLVMEYLPYNMENFLDRKECTIKVVKKLLSQLVLGLQYMHSQGVVHRDLKLTNLMVGLENGEHVIKICDFGLSRIMGDGRYTPKTVTSIYRAPEICCGTTYDKKSDVWSFGACVYEMVCKKPFLRNVEDNNSTLLNKILCKLPTSVPQKLVKKMTKNKISVAKISSNFERKSFIESMNLSKKFIDDFNSTPGSLSELEDLLEKTLCFDPNERHSANTISNHVFFDFNKEHMDAIRISHEPIPQTLPYFKIMPCIERKWVSSLVFELYNTNKNPNLNTTLTEYIPESLSSWYSSRVIFHAIDLFDRYIVKCFKNVDKDKTETSTEGRFHNKHTTYLYFYTCLYIMHKYYSTLEMPEEWGNFVPSIYKSEECITVSRQFENNLLHSIKNQIYRKTLLEMAHEFADNVTDTLIRTLLIKHCTLTKPWTRFSVRALYRHLMNIKESKEKKQTSSSSSSSSDSEEENN